MVDIFIGLIFLIIAGILAYYNEILQKPDGVEFTGLTERLSADGTMLTAYRLRLRAALAWLDRFFEYTPKISPTGGHEWSPRAFDRILVLSMVYPIIAAIIGWLIFGDAGRFGEALGFTSGTNSVGQRAILGMGGIIALICFSRKKIQYYFAGILILLGLLLILPRFGINVPVLYFMALLSLGFLINSILAEDDNTLTAASLIAIIAMMLVILTIEPWTLPSLYLKIITIGAAIGISIITVNWLGRERDRSWPYLLVTILMATIAIICISYFSAQDGMGRLLLTIALALLLIPLINAPFDFLSIGLTRYCLRKSLSSDSVLTRAGWAALDLTIALFCMVALCVVMVFGLEAFNALTRYNGAAEVIAPVGEQIAQLRDATGFEGRHFWLYFALFTTLAPTIFHLVIWLTTLISNSVGQNRFLLARLSEERLNHTGVRMVTAGFLTAQWVGGTVLAALISYGLFKAAVHTPLISQGFLWIIETTHSAALTLFPRA